MTAVRRYGVHWAPGQIAYLLQDTLYQHVLPYSIDCPYRVEKSHTRFACPHKIQLNQADMSLLQDSRLDDPLFHALNPAPIGEGEPNFFGLQDPTGARFSVISRLIEMSSPTINLVTPVWYRNTHQIHYRLHMTNVSPVVITGVTMAHGRDIVRLRELAAQTERRVLLVFKEPILMPTGCEMLETELREKDLEGLNLKTVGATLLRNYMRPPNG